MAKVKLADGTTVSDGDQITIVLWSAEHGNADTGQTETIEKLAAGTVHSFDHLTPVFNERGYLTTELVETRWELTTGDPQYPAIGFTPETARIAKA